MSEDDNAEVKGTKAQGYLITLKIEEVGDRAGF